MGTYLLHGALHKQGGVPCRSSREARSQGPEWCICVTQFFLSDCRYISA